MNFFIAQSSAIHTTVQDWSRRVVKNGGALPSGDTHRALSNFCGGLDKYGLASKMRAVNCFVPDNLIASTTPLIKTYGNDPWTNAAFVASDLTIAGLKGDGSTKYLDTGVNPSTALAVGSAGCSIYVSLGNTGNESDNGVWSATPAANQMGMYISYGGSSYWDCWNSNGGRTSGANASFTGFITFNRTSTTSENVYKASSTVPYTAIAVASGQSSIGTQPNANIYIFRQNGNTGGSSKRFSFAAIHDGLSVNDGASFFNLVQTMRQQLGGGYV